MTLFHEAVTGIDKQIADLEDAIRDLRKERKEIMKQYGIEDEIHPLIQVIKKYKRVSKLKHPTNEQCKTLIQLYGEPAVLDKLKEMDNWRDINKRVYIYDTMCRWFKKDRVNPTAFGFKEDWKQTIESAKKQIARQGTIQPGDLTKGL